MLETHAPGVFVVRWRSAERDAEPEAPPLEAIRASARAGCVGIVLDVGKAVRWVDVSVPTVWLRATADASLRIRAMAIVTESVAVGTAAAAFAAACAVRGTELEVRSFRATGPALAWVTEALASRSPLPATG